MFLWSIERAVVFFSHLSSLSMLSPSRGSLKLNRAKPGVWGCVQTREVWSTEEESHIRPGHFWRRSLTYVLDTFGSASLGRFLVA